MAGTSKSPNAAFEWHRLQEYGLPWESSDILLSVWKRVCHMREDSSTPLPTVRQARWWWRVHLAAPDVTDPMDLFLLAQRFVIREILSDLLGQSAEMRDLDAHLAY